MKKSYMFLFLAIFTLFQPQVFFFTNLKFWIKILNRYRIYGAMSNIWLLIMAYKLEFNVIFISMQSIFG